MGEHRLGVHHPPEAVPDAKQSSVTDCRQKVFRGLPFVIVAPSKLYGTLLDWELKSKICLLVDLSRMRRSNSAYEFLCDLLNCDCKFHQADTSAKYPVPHPLLSGPSDNQ